jgi:hypothetical protein
VDFVGGAEQRIITREISIDDGEGAELSPGGVGQPRRVRGLVTAITDPPSRLARRRNVFAASRIADGRSCHRDVAPPTAINRRGRGNRASQRSSAASGVIGGIGDRDR